MYLRAVGRRFTQMNAYFLVMNSKRCTMAAATSALLTIVNTGITIVSYFGNVTASLFALTIVRKFTRR